MANIKFEHTEVFNFAGAFRGMRNPMDSWDKSDSHRTVDLDDNPYFDIGPEDMKLANKLIIGGTEHRKFLRQITVCVDITAPRYWWQEFDTYMVGVTKNSCSTMHKLQSMPFSLDMFGIDGIEEEGFEASEAWCHVIKELEALRVEYNRTKDYAIFRQMKQLLPESFLQKRTVTMNYEVLFNILRQRGSHRLSEWFKYFMEWMFDLPHFRRLAGVSIGDQ